MAYPKKNTAFTFSVGLTDRANRPQFKANPTLATGDFKVSIDGGAFANLATLPTVTPAAGARVQVALSSGEMNGDNILIQAIDAAGAEWDDVVITINTTVRSIDDLAFPATSGRSMVVDAAGLVDANTVKIGPTGSGTAQTARDVGGNVDAAVSSRMATYTQPTGFLAATFPTTVASPTNITSASGIALAASQHVIVDSGTVTTLTNLPAITAGWLTATGIAAAALNGKGDWSTVTPTNLTAAQIATGVWQDATAGDFTVASSIGKSLYTTGNAPGAASGLALVGSNMGTVSSVTGSVGSVTGAVGSVTGAVGSVTGAVGSVTGAVGSVTGNVGGNVVGSVASVTAAVTLPSIPANWITAAGINAAALNGKGDWSTVTPTNLTAAQIATGVWQDATAGDFTVASSIGKSLYTTGNAPGAASGLALVGSNVGTATSVTGSVGSVTGAVGSVTGAVGSVTGNVGGNVTGSVGSVTGLTVANLDAAVSSRMATYTQPTGFLAATFPTGTIANTTNITAGTITTTTNLTNAATAGDLTATMKTSVTTAATAATPTAAAVTGNVGGNVVGTVSGVTPAAAGAAMTLTSGERTAVADALLDRNLATGTDSGGRTVRNALRPLVNKWTASGTAYTVTKEDDATTAWTATLTATGGANPITASDPA